VRRTLRSGSLTNLHANILQVGQPDRLAELFAMITERSARLMNVKDYGIEVGNPADIVIVDARSRAETVATVAPVLAAFKRGRQTVDRPRAKLIRPD
jgi:cytosine deaminase